MSILEKKNTILVIIMVLLSSVSAQKLQRVGRSIPLRPVVIKNIAYNARGTFFTVPNYVSAGSVAIFWVNQQGSIAPVPSRLSENNFVRAEGLSFLRKKKEDEPGMAFITLPELLAGYSVDCSPKGDTIAIAGGRNVLLIAKGKEKWETINTITVGTSVTRAVFSPDGLALAVLSDGALYLFSTTRFNHIATVEPPSGFKFGDVAFSHTGSRCALFEYHNAVVDYRCRIRIFDVNNNMFDRDLPWFPVRPSAEPGKYFPLVSFSPADSLLAVTVPATLSGKVYLIKSNDGSVVKEYKGFSHSFSPDGTLFSVQNKVLSTKDWSEIGKFSGSVLTCTFSPTDRTIITVTHDAINRFRIE